VRPLLPEALSHVESGGCEFIVTQVDFDRIVGESVCVATEAGDQIVYAQRPKRFGLTRFVKNRKPEPCKSVVVILKTADGQLGAYVLLTAFIGQKAEPEPWDRNATAKSREFWNFHALVWGAEPIIDGTQTTSCPW
jgi:hypothetical protein